MPVEVTDGAESDDWRDKPQLIMSGPICRAAPTRLAPPAPGSARSRRWLIACGIAVAALLAGASAALTSGGTSPAHPAHAVARPDHAKQSHNVAVAPRRDDRTR
jgi:hypothetical protein